MFDEETLAEWTKQVQGAFPGCKVVEWKDRSGQRVDIESADGKIILNLWAEPEEEKIHDMVDRRLFMAVLKVTRRQENAKTKKQARKMVEAK